LPNRVERPRHAAGARHRDRRGRACHRSGRSAWRTVPPRTSGPPASSVAAVPGGERRPCSNAAPGSNPASRKIDAQDGRAVDAPCQLARTKTERNALGAGLDRSPGGDPCRPCCAGKWGPSSRMSPASSPGSATLGRSARFGCRSRPGDLLFRRLSPSPAAESITILMRKSLSRSSP
jgi:hypothetical protein